VRVAPKYPLAYTDELPFPGTEIIANRALLCDYGFFGGAARTCRLFNFGPW
jgi:hypothetical protein